MAVLLKLAWYDGWISAIHGASGSECPWPADSMRGSQWLAGHTVGVGDHVLRPIAAA